MHQFELQHTSPKRALFRIVWNLAESVRRTVRSRREEVSAEGEYDTLLGRVISSLDSLNRRTEQDFLAVGGKLVEFHAAARQISSEINDLRELIAGSGRGDDSQLLTRILEQSRQIEARAESGDRALAVVGDSAQRIGQAFNEFRNTVSEFDVLGPLLRIETARLGSTGAEFGNVAEELGILTQSIRTVGQGILDASLVLRQSMRSALGRVTGLRASELQALPALTGEVVTSLESMEERNRRVQETSLRQSAEYDEVSAAIEDLITAVQFHDITRQQVEHVADALRKLQSDRRSDGRSHFTAPPGARAVLRLQASQLSNAETVFATSVDRIQRNLDSVAIRVANMSEASSMLMGGSTGDGGSFLLQLERSFTAILKALSACTKAETETQSALAELDVTVAQLRESVAEVVQIEIRIRRVAINATIRAVQIGGAGDALNVLAEVMQRLALGVSTITDEVSGALGAINNAANGTPDGSSLMSAGEHAVDETVPSEMRATILELHSSSERSLSRMNQIAALSSRLRDDIQSIQTEFSAGRIFAEAIEAARATLETIGGQDDVDPTGDAEVQEEQSLADFTSSYTMRAEREVHELVATGAVASQSTPVDEAGASPDAEVLGNNVEFF